MLGIWHDSYWLERDLVQSIYGRVEHGNPILGWFLHSLMKSWIFEKKNTFDSRGSEEISHILS